MTGSAEVTSDGGQVAVSQPFSQPASQSGSQPVSKQTSQHIEEADCQDESDELDGTSTESVTARVSDISSTVRVAVANNSGRRQWDKKTVL